ncbi:MAG TPA: hypothetical protein ACFCUY_15800 [Xenococcaceae cyanobacterium]|jgi:hypothetical protein
MTQNVLLEQTANSYLKKTNLPPASEVTSALLEAEKATKKQKVSYSFEQLIGTWHLCFVTGTKRKKTGVSIGKGQYLPRFIKIYLSYYSREKSVENQGKVENCVNLGLLQISLTGPVKFLAPKNILAFDFTRMKLKLFGVTLYDGYIRSGETKEASFYTDKISQQAFFNYFYLSPSAIAARGRGGGLALWCKASNH